MLLDTLRTGYGIHRIMITSRMLGFGVNCYLVEQPYPTLIDVPPDEKGCIRNLQSGLKSVGYSIEDIQRIIITHPHFDHFGSARTLCELGRAKVWVLKNAAQWLEDFEGGARADEKFRCHLLAESGADSCQIEEVKNFYRRAHRFARSVSPARYLEKDDNLELSSTMFTVTTVPGHTPCCILLHDVGKNVGFSGDFLQPITLNPLIQRTLGAAPSYNSLKSYIISLQEISTLGLQIALPGHGEIIKDVPGHSQGLLKMILEKRKRIINLLTDTIQTPFEISQRLFPHSTSISLFNSVFDVVAHLQLLEESSLIRKISEHPSRFSLL